MSKHAEGRGGGGKGLKRQNSRLAWESRVTAPSVKLDLFIECRRLPKKNSFSDADAFCGIWEAPPGFVIKDKNQVTRLPSKQEREVGRTEVVRENENPRFETTFRLEYKFQFSQTYVIRVYDEDLKYATDLKEHDFVGGCIFTLGELIGAAGCTIAKPIQQGKAFVVLTGQEIVETREVLEFRFSGQDLGLSDRKAKKGSGSGAGGVANVVLAEMDTFFRLEKLNKEDLTWTVVWKSEVVRSSDPNPTWQAARIPLQLLCDDKPTNPVKITIWQWNRFTNDDLVGVVETTVDDMVQKARRGIPVFDVMVEKKTLLRGVKLKKAGVVKVLKATILNIPSMLQYLSGGCEMDLMVAIDCTEQNGDWRKKDTLHYSSQSWLNDYQAVLFKVGSVFDGYNSGKKGYIMWGYGGATSESAGSPYFVMGENIRGADNLVKAYDKIFNHDNKNLELGEEGNLHNLIEAAMFRASNANKDGRQCYATLVILTTGVVSDLTQSIDTICAAAEDAPLSIAVIGIGKGDFSAVHKLAGGDDRKLLHSNGVPITRDIINFSSMADFGGNARECVAAAFQDVPEQFVQHFTNAGVKPCPPNAMPDFTEAEVFGKKKKESSKEKENEEKESTKQSSQKSKDGSKKKKDKSSSKH